jgi:hypothetical protein
MTVSYRVPPSKDPCRKNLATNCPESSTRLDRPLVRDAAKFRPMTVAEVLQRLPRYTQHGRSYRAACPAHGGDNPTALDISDGRAHQVVLHCHAHGCTYKTILRALGLWRPGPHRPPPPKPRPRRRKPPADPDTPVSAEPTASTVYAAAYLGAILADEIPTFSRDERLGCYLALCEDLGRVYADHGHAAARATWTSWGPDLEQMAPALLVMLAKGVL